MSEYLIQGETLEAIGDEVRRLKHTQRTYSPTEMATALSTVTAGGSGSSSGSISDCDEFKFLDFPIDPTVEIGDNGSIDTENSSRMWVLDQVRAYYSYPASEIADTNFYDQWPFREYAEEQLVSMKLPACEEFQESGSSNLICCELPACTTLGGGTFYGAYMLERVVLNSACSIADGAFDSGEQRDTTLKIYLKGDTMGECDENAFETETPERLEIYVPPSLLTSFKENWANGLFADYIYADPEVSA